MNKATCPGCGAPLLPLEELAGAARQALEAFRGAGRRPDALQVNITLLATALACHAGVCGDEERRPTP